MLSVYDTHAPKLLAIGAHPLVIAPGTKKPAYAGWTDPGKEAVTVPQPDAGIGARLGKQANGTYLVAIDWDNDEAALAALEKFPPAVMKEGARGLTMIYKSYTPVSSRDFQAKGVTVVQVLSDGRQSVLPPSIHPDTKRPYVWTSKFSLYDLPHIDDLPSLPHDYLERIEKIIAPLGYQPEPEKTKFESDNPSPYQELNDLALRNLEAWVPSLNLYKCRRRSGRYPSYEAVATWRPSNGGRPNEQRKLKLQISGKAIVDFGDGHKGYSPIDLVMAARSCPRDEAIGWLQERVQGGPEVDWENIGKQETKTEQQKGKRLIVPTWKPIDPATFPARSWLYGKHYQRGTVSATVAPGGAGKSNTLLVEALVMATNLPLLREFPQQRCRVWIHNGEDQRDEMERRILAICQHFKIDQAQLEGWLFYTSGTEFPLKVAAGYSDLRLNKEILSQMVQTAEENQYDVCMFDPLISMHSIAENDNNKMRQIVETFLYNLASPLGLAVELAHHTRKIPTGQEIDLTINDARGGGAFGDACRSVRVFNGMSAAEAAEVGISEYQRRRYFRIDLAKANFAPPTEDAMWRCIESVVLPNGDDTGVVTVWDYPNKEELEQSPGATADEDVFLTILGRFTAEGRTVNAHSGTTFAPNVFASEPEALKAGMTKRRIQAAMKRLMKNGRIRSQTHANGSHIARR
jgi:RecA-family ATPase